MRFRLTRDLPTRCHFHGAVAAVQPLEVLADVVAVTLHLSSEELLFSFSLDNWDEFVEQVSH
jgi:hypothetical protein